MPGRAPMGGGMMGGARVSNADEVRASLEYQQYEQMGQEIREALLQVRQEARAVPPLRRMPPAAASSAAVLLEADLLGRFSEKTL